MSHPVNTAETLATEGVTSTRTGLFLAFEGVEGSGKTTQAARLRDRLSEGGIEVVLAREPGSTPLGERVRAIVLDAADLSIPAQSELFLMLAARAAFVSDVVLPAVDRGAVVIADRFELSTLAYQGAGRGLSPDEIVRANRLATGGVVPDATFLLDLEPEEGERRQTAVAKRKDRLEREGMEFHRRVARGYRDLAPSVSGLIHIDAAGTVEEVGDRILEELSARFPETFPSNRFIT